MKKSLAVLCMAVVLLAVMLVAPAQAVLADSSPNTVTTVDIAEATVPEGTELQHGGNVGLPMVSAATSALYAFGASGFTYGGDDILNLVDATTGLPATGGGTIPVNAPNVGPYDTVMVMHWNGTSWDDPIIGTPGDGYFTFTTPAFSPFVYFLYKGTPPPAGVPATTPTLPANGLYE